MILEIEIDPQRLALLRGFAGYHERTLGEHLAEMIDSSIAADSEGAAADLKPETNNRPPPLAVRIRRR